MDAKTYSIIGCQHAHIEIFIGDMQALGYRCAGIYEPDNRALAATVAGKYGIPVVDDMERLLADPVGVVGCAAIHNEKIGVIELCESRGKHVMVDKPAVTDEDGLERLKQVARRGAIQVGMLLTERFHPAIYTLKRHIDQGKLGTLVGIGMRKPHRLNPASRPDWFFSKEKSGGILIDLLIHDFDLLRWFTGREIQRTDGVVGKSILPEHPGFYNTVNVQVVLEDGMATQLYADWHTPGKSWTWGDGRIFAAGTEGCAELRLAGDPMLSAEPLLLEATNREEWSAAALETPPWSITEDFLRRIRGESSILTHDDLVKASEAAILADQRVTFAVAATKGG